MVAVSSERVRQSRTRQAVRALMPQSVLNWREARYYERYGEIEMRFVDLLCRRGEDAIDVGANYGGYVHLMRRHASHVIAFEPVPEFVHLLRAKFANDVTIEPVALSDRAGEVDLCIPVIDGDRAGGCATLSPSAAACYTKHDLVRVRSMRLDDAYVGTAGFIKIDVEGHEQEVLNGAVATLRHGQPRVLVEIEECLSPGGIAHTSAFLARLGYRGYYIHAAQLHDIATFSVDRLQTRAALPDMTVPLHRRPPLHDYVYNFIFLPPGDREATALRIRERLAQLA